MTAEKNVRNAQKHCHTMVQNVVRHVTSWLTKCGKKRQNMPKCPILKSYSKQFSGKKHLGSCPLKLTNPLSKKMPFKKRENHCQRYR